MTETMPVDERRLPDFSSITPETIEPKLEAVIGHHSGVVSRLVTERPTSFESAWLPLEKADVSIDEFWWTVTHLHMVADTAELRAAFAKGEARLTAYRLEVQQNRRLYDLFVSLAENESFATLPQENRAAVERLIRDFKLAGVALEGEKRSRFAEVMVELSELSTAFGSAVLDATESWAEHITDETKLDGLSAADKGMLRAAATARGLTGWLVTLHQPSVSAVLTFGEDRALRERVYEAFGTRASEQGPDAGKFDNSGRIARLLQLRHDAADLLGFADPADWSLATKMADSAGEVLSFLRDLGAKARPTATRELAELEAFAAKSLGIDNPEPWDLMFAANRLRQERYSIDETHVRSFFPIEAVLDGWQRLLRQLFGIALVARSDVPLWHEDARYFDVLDADGCLIAGLYVDLYARSGKQSGAWMAPARARTFDGDQITLPAAYLNCNFSPPSNDSPSLLNHYDIRTLLHETGHCLHQLFTRVNRPSIGGISGFEWDAVELPSQLMEDFAWDQDVLKSMSRRVETNEQLPDALYENMIRARHFHAGLFIVRQLEMALFDLLVHLGSPAADPMTVLEAVRDEVAAVRPPQWHRLPHAFSHIFSGSYACGYYSYLWAEVLAADAFQCFAEEQAPHRETGDRLRREILSRGAVRPASKSFRAFRGRDANPQAMLQRHGLDQEACLETS